MNAISKICRRHWAAFLLIAFWFVAPWVAVAVTGNLTLGLPLSWMGGLAFAIYMYRATSGSQLLGILPLARREVWQITCVVGAIVPALVQLVVAVVVWFLVSVTFPHYASTHRAGIDTLALGAVYSLAFLQLALIATASLQRLHLLTAALAIAALGTLLWFVDVLPARLSEFTNTSALVFWVAAVLAVVIVRSPGALAAPVPARLPSYRLTLDLPRIGILDRLTGVKRILLVHTLFGLVCFGAAFCVALVLDVWMEQSSVVEFVANELRAFSGSGGWLLRPGDSLFFLPMWIIGFANIWTPMAHQLRILPLTPRQANALFLASPVAMWVVLWAMYLAAYALIVGGPMTPRLDLFLAMSGTSTLANVLSLRWKNRLFGMFGAAFVYGFWIFGSIVALVLNLTEAQIPLVVTGIVLYGAAIAINHHTLVHSTSASPAYQRQPKFFDTPARS